MVKFELLIIIFCAFLFFSKKGSVQKFVNDMQEQNKPRPRALEPRSIVQEKSYDPNLITQLLNDYQAEIASLPEKFHRQLPVLLKKGPQATRERAKALSSYHPARSLLLTLADRFEVLLGQKKDQLEEEKVISGSLGETDLNDFSDPEFSIGEEVTELSEPNPIQVAEVKVLKQAIGHKKRSKPKINRQELQQAILWSEILSPPKSMRK